MKIKAISTIFVLSLFATPFGLVGLAQADRDNPNRANELEESAYVVSEDDSVDATLAEQARQQVREDALKRALEIKEQAKLEAQERKTVRTFEARQQSCEARKQALANKIGATSLAASGHVERFGLFKSKVEDFALSRNLTIDSVLLEDANSKSDLANKAVETLQSVEQFDIECTDVDSVGQSVSAYKTALTEAREALKSYRTSLVALLVSVKTSASEQESVSAGEATDGVAGDESTAVTEETSNY